MNITIFLPVQIVSSINIDNIFLAIFIDNIFKFRRIIAKSIASEPNRFSLRHNSAPLVAAIKHIKRFFILSDK